MPNRENNEECGVRETRAIPVTSTRIGLAGSMPIEAAPRPPVLTKLISLDGLVGWDNRIYEHHQDVIYRHVIMPLSMSSINDPLTPASTYRRAYRFNGSNFDQERGVFVNEYREIYTGGR